MIALPISLFHNSFMNGGSFENMLITPGLRSGLY